MKQMAKRKELGISTENLRQYPDNRKIGFLPLNLAGIFIQFNEEAVCDWENRNASRYLK